MVKLNKNQILIIVGILLVTAGLMLDKKGYSEETTLSYEISYLGMDRECLGEIKFAPTVQYPLEVYVQEYGTTVHLGTKRYTSGEYGAGDTLVTSPFVADPSKTYKIIIKWKRIKYVDMDNLVLNGRYDHGEIIPDPVYNHCYTRLKHETSTSCGYEFRRVTYSRDPGCKELAEVSIPELLNPLFSSSDCTGEVLNSVTNDPYYVKQDTCPDIRVGEGAHFVRGTDATGPCLTARSALFSTNCDFCYDWSSSSSIRTFMSSCTEGACSEGPERLCKNIDSYASSSTFTTDGQLDFSYYAVIQGTVTGMVTATSYEDFSVPRTSYLKGLTNFQSFIDSVGGWFSA